MTTLKEFSLIYKKTLDELKIIDPLYKDLDNTQKTVDCMIKSLSVKSRYDCLKHNPAMKKAFAKIGITKSLEAREFISSHYEEEGYF